MKREEKKIEICERFLEGDSWYFGKEGMENEKEIIDYWLKRESVEKEITWEKNRNLYVFLKEILETWYFGKDEMEMKRK